MRYFKLLTQSECFIRSKRKEYYCGDDGCIYSKSLTTGKFMKLKPNLDRYGYYYITQLKSSKVHRLVYEAVTQEPIPEGMTVDHINNVKTDNRFCNLQLLTARDNAKKANDVPVDMLDLEETFIQTFPSISDATRWLRSKGFIKAQPTNISHVCKGRHKTSYSFKWRYHSDG